MSKVAVVALGGNAISKPGEKDTIPNQFRITRESLASIVELLKEEYLLAITHGNGPQVGNALLRVELARGKAPILPLGICVADVEGGMGYMIAQSLLNRLHHEGIDRDVVAIVTQVMVDRNDPAMSNPTKFIGQFYPEEEIRSLAEVSDWMIKKDPGRGWRRVVPSPEPLEIVERNCIKKLVENGTVVIAAGGGGIPVYVEDDGTFEGVDVVIDKDKASAVLGKDIGAELLFILTDVEKVALNFKKPNQVELESLTTKEAKKYLDEGHFPKGSMGAKIEAAINFINWGGKEVIITSIEKAYDAALGKAGTVITK